MLLQAFLRKILQNVKLAFGVSPYSSRMPEVICRTNRPKSVVFNRTGLELRLTKEDVANTIVHLTLYLSHREYENIYTKSLDGKKYKVLVRVRGGHCPSYMDYWNISNEGCMFKISGKKNNFLFYRGH